MYTANLSVRTLIQELGWDGNTYFDCFIVANTDSSMCAQIDPDPDPQDWHL